ncbi:MAG: hypothetical protein WDN04_23385 [Rhodospirillales bacterium]
MQADGGQPHRRHQAIQVGDRAATDERQGAAQAAFRAGQQFGQIGWHKHCVGVRGEVDQRAVDVKEQG